MRVLLALLAAVATLASAAGAAADPPREAAAAAQPPLLAFGEGGPFGEAGLSRRHPLTLAPISAGLSIPGLNSATAAWSPNRRLLALKATNDVVIVDVQNLRVHKRVTTGAWVTRVVWLSQRIVVALSWGEITAVDVVEGDVAWRRSTGGGTQAAAVAGQLVLLEDLKVGGSPRIAVYDDSGNRRGVSIELIAFRGRFALVGDSSRGRAYVIVPKSPVIADLHVKSGAVAYRQLGRPLDGLTTARLAPPRTIVLSELDGYPPVGISAIDTRTWRVREIDREAPFFHISRGHLVIHGSSSMIPEYWTYPRLSGYGLTGKLRYRLFDGRRVGVGAVRFPYAYACADEALAVIDIRNGRVVRRAPCPSLVFVEPPT